MEKFTVEELWKTIVAFQGCTFYTVSGLPFSYTLKVGKNGVYNKELVIDRRKDSKTLAWSSILLAFEAAVKMQGQEIKRPKALGDIRGVSYVYPMFYRFGIISVPETIAGKMQLYEEAGLR